MGKYKVISLHVGGKGSKVFNAGDIVTEKSFPDGTVDGLVKNGFIRPVDEPTKEPVKTQDVTIEEKTVEVKKKTKK